MKQPTKPTARPFRADERSDESDQDRQYDDRQKDGSRSPSDRKAGGNGHAETRESAPKRAYEPTDAPTDLSDLEPASPDSAATEDDHDVPAEKPGWSLRKKVLVGGAVGLVILAGAVVGLLWYLEARHFEKTDDAYIDAHNQAVASQVAGRVLKVLVQDNEQVTAGQVLVELDPADFRVTLEQARASVAEAEGRAAQAAAQKLVAEANAEQSKADVDQATSKLQNAENEYKRYEGLSKEAVSQQRLDDLRTAVKTATSSLKAAQKGLGATEAQVQLADSQIRAAKATVQASQAQVSQAELQLSYAQVKAAVAGRVTGRGVQDGDYVQSGRQLMLLVPREVWVTANYKETQLTDMRPGQPVTIEVDAFPDTVFHGKVQSVQAGSGAAFSLLPPQNATGNFVKVVQRVPVKITFDETQSDVYERLGPGMSVVPKVRVR